eukprot:TRINITY_DN11062_c0_g1_i1.p1 TRINITY_DN11062_c0_g1~~TRINITY_DN11062_c0_g1_i1.p1  ORF type:complete len:105 (+),score=24.04 TRINITY_DN11062_c0_g1_i1:77-391(+)
MEGGITSTGLQSGHWESEKGGKHYFCTVSGGYVCIGVRNTQEIGKEFAVLDASNCEIEKFASSAAIRDFLRKNLGDKVLEQVGQKVAALVELKNRRTAAPAKES